MRKLLLLLMLVATSGVVQSASVARAEEVPGQLKDAIAMARKDLQTERQAIVAENLALTDAESNVFWPMYREYMNEKAKLGDRTQKLIEDYGKAYSSLDDATAKKMIQEVFSIDQAMVGLKKNWAGKMAKQVSPVTVARFIQIENTLDALVRFGLGAEVPLAWKGAAAASSN